MNKGEQKKLGRKMRWGVKKGRERMRLQEWKGRMMDEGREGREGRNIGGRENKIGIRKLRRGRERNRKGKIGTGKG